MVILRSAGELKKVGYALNNIDNYHINTVYFVVQIDFPCSIIQELCTFWHCVELVLDVANMAVQNPSFSNGREMGALGLTRLSGGHLRSLFGPIFALYLDRLTSGPGLRHKMRRKCSAHRRSRMDRLRMATRAFSSSFHTPMMAVLPVIAKLTCLPTRVGAEWWKEGFALQPTSWKSMSPSCTIHPHADSNSFSKTGCVDG